MRLELTEMCIIIVLSSSHNNLRDSNPDEVLVSFSRHFVKCKSKIVFNTQFVPSFFKMSISMMKIFVVSRF